MKKVIFYITTLFIIGGTVYFFGTQRIYYANAQNTQEAPVVNQNSPTPTQTVLPRAKTLQNSYHVYQTFNNCGPASLSMALSYFGINATQAQLGQDLRPYQNPQGNNDDKSVSLNEMAAEAENYGLLAYYRPNGSVELIKKFINAGMPVITETLLKPTDDIGHYRVVKGYNDTTKQIVQDDSMQGPNLRFSYSEFDKLWQPYDYQFLVLVPKDKQSEAEAIIGENLDWTNSWKIAVGNMKADLLKNPGNINDTFNLSVAYFYIGDYQNSIKTFESVQDKLPARTLWYQDEPIQAYYQLGDYQKVFDITDKIINNGDRAYSELYIIRGNIYKNEGNIPAAKEEYQKAVFYNVNMKAAQDALKSVS